MSGNNDGESDCPGEGHLSPWEKKCLDEWEKESILEDRLQAENERSSQKMWQSFQNSATAVSRLFKDGHDLMRRSFELGTQAGINRRTREILAWTKKRRRRIPRDDLIAYLCGNKTAPPPRNRTCGGQFSKTPIKSASSTSAASRFAAPGDSAAEPDLQLFQDALALHGLDGAMSNVSVGRRQSTAPTLPNGAASVAPDDYHGFLLEQIASHCTQRKRSVSGANKDPNSPSSSSPGHKRFRFENDDDL